MKAIHLATGLVCVLILLLLGVSWKIHNSKSTSAKESVVKKVTLEDEENKLLIEIRAARQELAKEKQEIMQLIQSATASARSLNPVNDAKTWWAPMNGGAYAGKDNKLYLIGFREDGLLGWKQGTE